jgi:phosphoglycerate kinase
VFSKKTIKDVGLKNKTVLIRTDYNVPVKDSKITDNYRIIQSLDTLNYLIDHQAKIVICSHLGRPDGQVNPDFSLKPVQTELAKLLKKPIAFAQDCIGEEAEQKTQALNTGEILLLENLRFHKEEEQNESSFAKALASYKDIFVEDGFGVVHRAHASTEGVTHFLPSVAGLLLEREVDTITNIMVKPQRPLVAIVGGAKVSDKIEILKRFIYIADFLAIGGALANPFIRAEGVDIKDSLYDPSELNIAQEIIKSAEKESKRRAFSFFIPKDVVVAKQIDSLSQTRIVDFASNSVSDIIYYPKAVPKLAVELDDHEKILDIGPFSSAFIAGAINSSATVVWNGTLGVTEVKASKGPIGPFAHASETVIEAMIGQFGRKPFSLVGGGDTVGYVESRGLNQSFNHVSTGGGASLELMSGHKLPGVEALEDKK